MQRESEGPADAGADPVERVPEPEPHATGTHLESVTVDTIDGQFVMPAEVEDGAGEELHVQVLDTTGAPVAENPPPEQRGEHLEPVTVDGIDGQFVVPAEAPEGFSESQHVVAIEATGAPVADPDDAQRNGFRPN
ncbi:MAG TPA: hypothetical protein VIL55_02160 [Naasia sp.]